MLEADLAIGHNSKHNVQNIDKPEVEVQVQFIKIGFSNQSPTRTRESFRETRRTNIPKIKVVRLLKKECS